MGATLQQPPAGYDVIKSAAFGRYMIVVYELDDAGHMRGAGFLVDPATPRVPQLYAKRAQAVTAAKFHQLLTENARLKAQSYRDIPAIDRSQAAARSVS